MIDNQNNQNKQPTNLPTYQASNKQTKKQLLTLKQSKKGISKRLFVIIIIKKIIEKKQEKKQAINSKRASQSFIVHLSLSTTNRK